MKSRFSWPRVLIGLLLLLNALPFTLRETGLRFAFGLILALLGLTVAFARIPDRTELTVLDRLRATSAACCCAAYIYFFDKLPPIEVIVFYLCLFAVMFIPWRFPTARMMAVARADQALYDLEAEKLISEPERLAWHEDLKVRNDGKDP